MNEMGEVLNEFLVESYESLEHLDREFVDLEKSPDNKDIITRIFRAFHTIKGTSGFLGFQRLESVTHIGESLLSKLRDGALKVNGEIITALLATVDAVRQILHSVEKTGKECETDFTAIVDQLSRLQRGETLAPAPAAPPAAPTPPVLAAPPVAPATATRPAAAGPPVPAARATTPGAPPVPAPTPASAAPAVPAAAATPTAPVAPVPLPAVAVAPPSPPTPPAADPAAADSGHQTTAQDASLPASPPVPPDKAPSVTDNNVRVDVALLDKIMNLVGELVLARNQVLQLTANQKLDPAFVATTQRLNLITSELQENVMKTRMQPIDTVWRKFPRVVRDLALGCGKQIRLEMIGEETELDRTILESIKDPLTHIIRNSIDHGFEDPATRQAAGKPAEGRLRLKAAHDSGHVVIEVSDDGRGIDAEKVKQSAIKKDLLTPERAARMSERELVELIFLPGFSTAEKVTNLSGRGVGMDVVKSNVEKIGGAVEIQTSKGTGTRLVIRIPLTLAIIPALTVTTQANRYAIPQVSLIELVRLEEKDWSKVIEWVAGTRVYRLRGKLLPLVSLGELLDGKDPSRETAIQDQDGAVNIIVLQAAARQFGLVVDGIHDTEEIVVKPLSKHFKHVPAFAGATIMGDGRVALILDVNGISQQARLGIVGTEAVADARVNDAADPRSQRLSLVVFQPRENSRMAIPLSVIARLEEVPVTSIEHLGNQHVMQYRGEILPLLDVDELIGYGGNRASVATEGKLDAVVYQDSGRSVGVLVGKILDIVEESISVRRPSSRPGVLCTAVVQGCVTEILDIAHLVRGVIQESNLEPMPA